METENHMLKVIATAALGALLAAAAPVRGQSPEPRPVEDPEAYAIYASLLPEEWTIRVAGASRLVVQRETGTHDECLPSGPPMKAEWAPVLADYRAQNQGIRRILPDRALGSRYRVVPRDEIRAIFEHRSPGPETPHDPVPAISQVQGRWKAFYDRYPDSGGYLVFSAVGFNDTKTRALVYIGHHCGNLCGGGAHHLMEKVDGQWRETRPKDVTMCMWMS
jgi:hypothetical protein